MDKFTCARRREDGRDQENSVFVGSGPNLDTWTKTGTCTYCGSLNPEILMEHLETGYITLTPTDKNYKVYVDGITDPQAGKPTIYSSANFKPDGKGWAEVNIWSRLRLPNFGIGHKNGSYVKVEPRQNTINHKFYFQHFSTEEKKRFIKLYSENKLHLLEPGYFYVLPFFMGRAE